MKTNQLFIFLFAVSVVVLNSCGTSRFGKSHYKNRDWVWVGSDKGEINSGNIFANEKNDDAESNNNVISKIDKKSALNQQKENNIINYNEENIQLDNNNSIKEQDNIESELTTPEESIEETNEVLNVEVPEEKKQNDTASNAADADAMFILMLILSLFLPPLAVYLKDSGITGLFWLTLILCLLGGGFLLGPGFGYLASGWFIAFILALLRVLDII